MIDPIMHILYLYYLKPTAISANNPWEFRFSIRKLADKKKFECRQKFYLEGEIAWKNVSDFTIKNFIKRYAKDRSGYGSNNQKN
jgi:hypothetical protein